MAKIQGTIPVAGLQERKKYLQQIIKLSQGAMHYPSSTRKQQKHKRPLQAYKQANQQ